MSGTKQASPCSQNSKSIVIPILLYACETWTVYRWHAIKLNHFHTVSLRKLLNIRRQDRIPDTEVLTRAGMPSIFTILAQAQLHWTGHVVHMPDHRIPKQLLYGELLTGKRRQGVQKRRFKDYLKSSLKNFEIDLDTWELIAQVHTWWRSKLKAGAATYEAARTDAAEVQRKANP